jgi:hypothetical protein
MSSQLNFSRVGHRADFFPAATVDCPTLKKSIFERLWALSLPKPAGFYSGGHKARPYIFLK